MGVREGDTADSRRGNVLATALRTSFGEEGNELRRREDMQVLCLRKE